MTQAKNILIFIFVILSSISLVSLATAHSLYLFGISLDFDQELKSNVIRAAQEFLNINKEPLGFDLDKGLIIVHFEPEQKNYVEVNPLGYTISGMRNENLKHNSNAPNAKTAAKKLTKEQGLEIAKSFFEKLPAKTKPELKYNAEISEVDNTYFYKWYRHVNGILVIGEDLTINVDAVNGNVIAWRLSIFDYPKENIETTAGISKNVAKRVAELTFNAQAVKDFKPYIAIFGQELVWVNKLQGDFYAFFVGVSAKDGSILFSGTIPGDIPSTYDWNKVKIVETDIIKQIYNPK